MGVRETKIFNRWEILELKYTRTTPKRFKESYGIIFVSWISVTTNFFSILTAFFATGIYLLLQYLFYKLNMN